MNVLKAIMAIYAAAASTRQLESGKGVISIFIGSVLAIAAVLMLILAFSHCHT